MWQIQIITYFELSADFLRQKSDWWLLAELKVPCAENLYRQIPVRLEDMKTFPDGLGYPVGEQYSHKTQNTGGLKKKILWIHEQFTYLSNLYTRIMQIMKKAMAMVKKYAAGMLYGIVWVASGDWQVSVMLPV